MNPISRTFLSVLMAGMFALPSAAPLQAATHDMTIVGGGSGGSGLLSPKEWEKPYAAASKAHA